MATQPKSFLGSRRTLPDARQIAQLAEQDCYSEAQRWFARERFWINDQQLQVCRVAAPTFFEQPRAEWFRNQLTCLGWRSRQDRAGNVLGVIGEEGDQELVVSAHLDTVLAPSRPEDISFTADGRLVGPGVSDNGSGLSALLALARVMAELPELRPLAARVLLVANVGEEGEGNLSGMRYLCRQSLAVQNIKAFLVLDGPSTEHITAQALASRRLEISFTGPGGHSWNDYGTPNPVHALSAAITSFIDAAECHIAQNLNGRCSYNFGIFEGGTSINSIPSAARAKLDLRSEVPAVLEDLSALLTSVVERTLEAENSTGQGGRPSGHRFLGQKVTPARIAGPALASALPPGQRGAGARTSAQRSSAQRLTAKIKDLGSRPGGKLPESSLLLRTVQAVDAHLNIRSRVECASTDANVPLSLDLPAVSIGSGGHGGGAHTTQEWYLSDGRELGLRRILLILAALAGENASDSK